MEIEKKTIRFRDGSYIKIYHKKGVEFYWHREDGPARIMYDNYGSIDYEEYRINDKSLSKEEWEQGYGWKLKLKGTPMGEIFGVKNE